MEIIVDGEPIDVLFDTGASFVLSDQGKKLLNTQTETHERFLYCFFNL